MRNIIMKVSIITTSRVIAHIMGGSRMEVGIARVTTIRELP